MAYTESQLHALETALAKGERRVVILQGLLPGEQVVTRANFLLDGESNLRAAFAGLTAPASAALPATDLNSHVDKSAAMASMSVGVSGAGGE